MELQFCSALACSSGEQHRRLRPSPWPFIINCTPLAKHVKGPGLPSLVRTLVYKEVYKDPCRVNVPMHPESAVNESEFAVSHQIEQHRDVHPLAASQSTMPVVHRLKSHISNSLPHESPASTWPHISDLHVSNIEVTPHIIISKSVGSLYLRVDERSSYNTPQNGTGSSNVRPRSRWFRECHSVLLRYQ